MFRARFHDAFPRSLPHFGPQDIERGVEEPTPGEYIERLLCALLGLVLNRKKDVEYVRHPMLGPAQTPTTRALSTLVRQLTTEPVANQMVTMLRRNHYTRPLEEAIHTHQPQWPKSWEGKNPLHGGRSFTTMTPEQRV